MKNKVFVIKHLKLKIFLAFFIGIIIFLICRNINFAKESEKLYIEENTIIMNTVKEQDIQKQRINIPEEMKGYKVIGKLEIPKIKLETYILNETSKKSLDISVTKLCGPEINNVGNLCITGHNYNKPFMFGKLKKLEKGDKIVLTDQYGYTIQYCVSEISKVNPKDVKCLSQDTNGKRQITLITCTTGAIKRLIIKANEIN